MDKPKDWYKSMFKAMHKAGRSGYVGESDFETDVEGGKNNRLLTVESAVFSVFNNNE